MCEIDIHDGKLILIVEDHCDTAEMLCILLEAENYRVKWTSTGTTAFEALSGDGCNPDLVLLDLSLPDMSGDDIIRRLQRERVKVPPVLIMSAKPMSDITQAAHAINAAAIVRKPFEVSAILDSIRSVLT
jgi:two-component system OmpR family response regulator